MRLKKKSDFDEMRHLREIAAPFGDEEGGATLDGRGC